MMARLRSSVTLDMGSCTAVVLPDASGATRPGTGMMKLPPACRQNDLDAWDAVRWEGAMWEGGKVGCEMGASSKHMDGCVRV